MRRTAVIASLFLAACDVGELPATGTDGGGGGTDGGGSGSDCEPIAAAGNIPTGHHNEGLGCRSAAGCHNAQLGLGTGAPEYSIAGTVYKDQAGTMPYPGATVFVTIGGMTHKTIAADNGNFWMVPEIVPGPTAMMTGTTKASACPNTIQMAGLLTAGGGDCNSGACHAIGSIQGAVYVTP